MKKIGKRILSTILAVATLMSCWVWMAPEQSAAAADAVKDHYLFAYFTDSSQAGQTIHMAVSKDGLNYTSLRNNEPVIIPSKGVGCVRDPYIWFNEQDNHYYIIATELDFTKGKSYDNNGNLLTYSEDGEGFIIWRSRDLVHWYDETMINVVEMSHLIGKTTNMTSVWAPQILWDGEAYVIYFTLRCDQTWNGSYNVLQPYYLRTTNLLDQDAYFEAGQIFNRNLHSIDMDIIQNPKDGKWYLFYKNEDNDLDPSGGKTDLKTIHYLVSSGGPTGPYNIGFWEYGTRVYPSMNNTNLEGCNSFFDNNGDLITFTDCYDASTGTFYVSKSSDFKTYTMLDSSKYNINTLSPRHGSVVKITEAQYNNLINNAYEVSSSSFPETENLEDHLVARYFTTTDTTYNAANGKNDLTISHGAIQAYSGLNTSGVDCYAMFDSAEGGDCAEIDLNKLLPNSLNYEDGFTVTFSLMTTNDSPNDGRVFSLTSADNQDRSNFAVVGGASGAYYDNVKDNVDKLHTIFDDNKNNISYRDGTLHHFVISSANGNIIVYVDGELVLKKSRFNYDSISQRPDDDWYEALGNGKLTIGYGYDGTYWYGGLSDFCLYDCSMSYYDIKQIQNEQDIAEQAPLDAPTGYTAPNSVVPAFKNDEATISSSHYANLLYSPKVEGTLPQEEGENKANPDSNQNRGQAAVASQSQYTNVGIYYSKSTVMYIDSDSSAPKMPVMLASRNNSNSYDSKMITAYPTTTNNALYLTQQWYGWTRYPNFTYAISNPDGSGQRIGHNSSTRLSADQDDANTQGNRSVYYYASVLALNTSNVINNDTDFKTNGYVKYDPSWYWEASTSGGNSSSGNASSTEKSSDHGTNHLIWVIDLRPYVTLKNQIVKEFTNIVTNTTYCPGAVAKYKAVVESIQKFNPKSFNYAGGTEAAVKACADQITKLKKDYDYVKSLLAPCSYETIPATEPTCTRNGTTAGSHCPVCGEIKVQPQLITKLAHDFGDTTITEGATIQCQNCDYSYTVKENEVKYGNLFNLSKFMFTNSAGVTNGLGRVAIDTDKDTMTFQSFASSGEAVTNASNSTGRDTTHGNYAIPVDGGETYVLEYFLTTKDIDTDVYIFCYDVENNCVANTYGSYYSNSSGKSQLHTYTVTVPESTRYVELRFDVDTAGGTATFANIGFYEKSVYDDYATQNPYSRIRFLTGESKELYTPKKIGYDFLGWYTSDGRKIDNTNQLSVTETVFPRWEQLGHTVNYNGNLFSLTDFAKTNDYKMQGSVQDGHVWADFNKGKFYTLSARETIIDADLTEAANFDTYNTPGAYKVPVTAGQEYVFTMTLASRAAYQCYLWFYNSSGGAVVHPATNSQWINHSTNKPDQGAVASWNGNTLIIRFTVPDGASQMSFRMGTTGQKAYTQTFSEIGLYTAKDYAIYETTRNCPAMDYVSSSQITLANPTRDGYDFMGWTTERFGKGTAFTDANTASLSGAKQIYPKWKINDLALADDSVVLDFGTPIVFDPVANDTKALNEADFTEGSYKLTAISSPNAKGTFSINSDQKTVTYVPAFNDVREITYTATLKAYEMETVVTGKVYVNAASNIFYEENKLSVDSTSSGVNWTGASTTVNNQETASAFDIYGYDNIYNNTANHSNGGAYTATVNSSNRTSQKLTFTFTGTGFELYGACGPDTGIQVINIKKDNKTLKAAVVDTYYSDNNYGMLYQAPIYNVSGLDYGTYTVEVTAAYLPSISGALQQSTLDAEGASTYDLVGALIDLGLDYILEADDVDVEWFDDESILNGGTGANDPTAFGSQSVTSLVNYVDAVRVFEPLNKDDTYYIDSEKNARYINIVDNLLTKEDFIQSTNGFVYVEGKNNVYNADTYKKNGSKHEVYLANSNAENALVFSVANEGGFSKVMLSLRAAYGNPVVKIGGETITVNSKTEMYYDVTGLVADDGTVTIQNASTDKSLLAIGYLKLTGNTSLLTTSDLSSAIEMIETPLDGEEITTGAITNVEYTPSTDSHNTFDVTVNGRPTMIQFIEEDGGTRTYDRNNKNVTIKSYNADGVEVNSLDRTVAYEVWTINTNLTGPEVKARAKFITDGAYKWEKNPYSFTYEILEPVLDADVRSITPAAESGKKGAVEVKVVTGPDAQGVRFVMPDGSTCTYNAAKAVTLENGDLEFTGKAWMNEDGLNTISVYIRENGAWTEAGEINYTVE